MYTTVYTGLMKNITFSVEDSDIEAARARARDEQTTLNEKVREWIRDYGCANDRQEQARRAMATIRDLRTRIKIDRKYTRDEMNER